MVLIWTLQVVNLQAQLASLKDQAPQSFVNGSEAVANPNENWFPELENSSNTVPQFNSYYHINDGGTTSYYENGIMNSNSIRSSNYDQNSGVRDENVSSYGSFEEASPSMSSLDMQTNIRQYWGNFDRDVDELQSMAFSYVDQHYWVDRAQYVQVKSSSVNISLCQF